MTFALPIDYNSATKKISVLESGEQDFELNEEVEQLNKLSNDLISITTEIPESPEPSKQLSPLIKKLITSGIDALKKKKLGEAIKQLTLAIEMAGRRSRWESFAIQLQELNGILQVRCDAYILNKQFIEAYNDADLLLGTQVNTPDNFLRRAIAALNLGRLQQSRADLERGLCFHENDVRLKDHLRIVERAIAIENGDIIV